MRDIHKLRLYSIENFENVTQTITERWGYSNRFVWNFDLISIYITEDDVLNFAICIRRFQNPFHFQIYSSPFEYDVADYNANFDQFCHPNVLIIIHHL